MLCILILSVSFFSVIWHPSGESGNVITLADNNILMWDVEASGTNATVSKISFSKLARSSCIYV